MKARYTLTTGEIREVKASQYVDSLLIEGFGNTAEYEISISCVDKFENESSPVSLYVKPLTPPVQAVFESLEWNVDFGGFLIGYRNEHKDEIAIYVTQRDAASGDFVYYDALYTKTKSGSYSVTGLPDIENDFGIYVRDKFNNYSDTLFFTTEPYLENELDKTKFSLVKYPDDVSWCEYNGITSNMWDGQVNEHVYAHTAFPVEFPHCVTINLGTNAILSRIHMWQRSRWEHGSWKRFKVYGATELPEADDNDMFAGWTLLGDFESIKPSGRPLYDNTDEDLQKYADGEDFKFPLGIPSVRYIRIAVEMSWSGMLCSTVSEISLWGNIED